MPTSKTLKEITAFVGGELLGDDAVSVSGINGIREAGNGELAFIINSKDEALIDSTKASCVIVPKDVKGSFNKSVIKVENPSVAFSKIIAYVNPDRIPHPKGIHETAIISKSAILGKNVSIGPYAVIADKVSIGDNTIIYPFCYIGKDSKVGTDCLIYPHVTIRESIYIGNRVIIHPSSVIGSDGFGYDTQKDGTHFKIPQLGTVVIEDDAEIGSCVTIDRARFNKTVIGKGSKIDNLCQIAHNVIIGPYCLIAAQAGIAGSSTLGRNVVFGGQVGVADHVNIGDFVMAGGKTGILRSFTKPKTMVFGYPARPVDKARDLIACVGLLPKLYKRVGALEAKLKEYEKK
ncbi:MAG: UDP-3-O-(3-hydroxymyristoyl)glucosamine N-acyltransferase [Candidatus Omnitrophota bacterium]|nr:UDP-3-O-(3-hydroxymyristoyl)glucosamine N-acyltransferase [Candidatus Omnitrophota bacterium]